MVVGVADLEGGLPRVTPGTAKGMIFMVATISPGVTLAQSGRVARVMDSWVALRAFTDVVSMRRRPA